MLKPEHEHPASLRARTYAIGLLLVALVCIIVAYGELVASRFGSMNAILLGASHTPPAAIGVLLALVIASTMLKRFGPKWGLSPAELAAIYVMMVCAALLSSFGLAAQLLPNLAGANYFADSQNEWGQTFFSHFPKWLVPFDPTGPDKQFVSKAYYEGLRQGERLPWGSWIVPLAAWSFLALLLLSLMACLATLLRRQWVDHEKLSFPLVQLPLEIIQGEASRHVRDRQLLWLGALIPFLFHGMNGLHGIAPNIPSLPSVIVLNDYLVGKPWTDVVFTPICVTFSVIGFAYLLPLDVSFSMWFFLLFFRFQDVVGSRLGYQFDGMPLYPAHFYIGYQAAGAAVAVCISLMWLARPHLKMVWERIKRGSDPDADSNEMMSYRTAFLGAAISFLLIVVWCYLAGMNLLIAAFVMFCFIFFVVLVMTRCVAEVGLLMLQGLFRPMDIWAVGGMRASLGAANLAPLALLNGVFMRDPRNLMPVFMDGMKLSDGVNLRKSNLGLAIGLAIPAAMLIAYYLHLHIVYKYGAIRLNSWFFLTNPTLYFSEAKAILDGPKGFDIRAPGFFTVGLLFTFFLYFMRARFWWWPFHPLGYAMGAAWPIMVYWSAFFVGWLIKSRLIKYGGIRAFRVFRPLFIGMILGEFVTAILWATLSAIFGCSSPAIPLT